MNGSNRSGWLAFLAALGIMSGLMVEDIKVLHNWSEIFRPASVANILAHFAATTLAFLGGRVIPIARTGIERTRNDDPKV